MSKVITNRELFVDKIFVCLQMFSYVLFIVSGLIGYNYYSYSGIIIGILLGYVIGKWIRYSLGIRGKDRFHGYYQRRMERAMGSRQGLLEFLIEKLRGNELSIEKCKRISDEYVIAIEKAKKTSDETEIRKIFKELGRRTKEISYEKE